MGKHIQHNHLKKIRIAAGLSKAALARLSGKSITTIRDIEEHIRGGNPETRNSLVAGLNKSNNISKEYTFREDFP